MASNLSSFEKLILAEAAKRSLKSFTIESFCFDKQIDFIRDPKRFKVGLCSRRSGKTLACAADLIDTAQSCPGTVSLYITLSRNNAKKIIWRELISIINEFNMDAKPNETDLSITFGNNSIIYLSGAKDAGEIEKFRGLALKKVYIDEAQSFRAFIKELINDIIEPALRDYNGSLILIGTPGPVCVGTFYDACHATGWSKHHWTILNNPWIKRKSGREPEEILKEELERRGLDESDASYQRESLGKWVNDLNALVFKYNPAKNTYTDLPESDWHYIFGIDIGYDDADAIAVIAYSHSQDCAYLVEESIKTKQDISALAEDIKRLELKYKPVKMVFDAGALGKKIGEELRGRFQLNVIAAEKSRKLEYIELFNDALRTSKIKIPKDSVAASDYTMIQWDMNSTKKEVSDTFHSDIADSILYAWREAKNYVQVIAEKKVDPTSQEAVDLWEIQEDERVARNKSSTWWEDL